MNRLAELYPMHSSAKIASLLKRSIYSVYGTAHKHGLRKSAEFYDSEESGMLRKGQTRPESVARQFKKGHVPANAGTRRPGYAPGRMRETQFKKGERRGAANRNYKPVGTIGRDPDGFLIVKVFDAKTALDRYGIGEGKSWQYLHRRVWIQHKGPIPPKHHIGFKDRNRENVAIDNLELVSFAEMARRNRMWNCLPRELAEAIQLNGVLKRKLRSLDGKK